MALNPYKEWCLWMFRKKYWTIWTVPKKYRNNELFRLYQNQYPERIVFMSGEELRRWVISFYEGECRFETLPTKLKTPDLLLVAQMRGEF